MTAVISRLVNHRRNLLTCESVGKADLGTADADLPCVLG